MIKISDSKKVRIYLAVSVALIVFIFAIVFFQFPDNSRESFVFRVEEDGYATLMGYTGNAKRLEVPALYEGHEVRYVAEYAFGGHYSALKSIVLPDTVREIGDYAFANSPELKEVVLPANLEKIGRGAFSYCERLKKIVLPASLKTIDDEAFYGCIRLAALAVPAGVTYIGTDAFASCENLLLDVSENPLAAEVAELYRIETGRVNLTDLYFGIILGASLVLLFLIFLVRYLYLRRKKRRSLGRDSETEGGGTPLSSA